MKITLITVGKIKEKYLKDAIAEYSKRLSRYCKLEIIEVADEKTPDNAITVPSRIILLSPSLSEIKPAKNLPTVMPIKNKEANAAALSFVTPLVPSK